MKRITKDEMVNGIQAKVEGFSKKDVEQMLNATFEYIAEGLAQGNEIPVHGFGTFSLKRSQEREGKNPQTKQKMIIPAKTSVKFSASSKLKNAVVDVVVEK